MPTKFAVFDMLPLNFFNCKVKYVFSKFSLASFKGKEKLFSDISILLLETFFNDSFIIMLMFSFFSFGDNIAILSTKFLSSLTFPGQSYSNKYGLLVSISIFGTPFKYGIVLEK